MANNAITITQLSENAYSAGSNALTVDTSSGAYVDVDGYDASKLLFVFTVSTNLDSGDTITVTAGTDYSAVGQGNLALVPSGSTAAQTRGYLAGLETARFKDTNDRINITVGTTEITAVEAILLP